jgi:hypothetical protein
VQLTIVVTFSSPVLVTGQPQLTLETGTSDAVIPYVSGSGTSALSFRYVVGAADVNPDLDYVSVGALGLNGGSIKSLTLSAATLTLPAPGAAGSLSANKNLAVAPTTDLTIGGCGCTGLEGLLLLALLRLLRRRSRRAVLLPSTTG